AVERISIRSRGTQIRERARVGAPRARRASKCCPRRCRGMHLLAPRARRPPAGPRKEESAMSHPDQPPAPATPPPGSHWNRTLIGVFFGAALLLIGAFIWWRF